MRLRKWGLFLSAVAIFGIGYLMMQGIDRAVGRWVMLAGLILLIGFRIASFLGWLVGK